MRPSKKGIGFNPSSRTVETRARADLNFSAGSIQAGIEAGDVALAHNLTIR